jgi:hypothetical protein
MFVDLSEDRTDTEAEDTAVPQILFGPHIPAGPFPCRFFSEGETMEGLQCTGRAEWPANSDISIPGIWSTGRDTVCDTMTTHAEIVAEGEGPNKSGSWCDQVIRRHDMKDAVVTVLLFDGQGSQTDRGRGIALPRFDDNVLFAGVAAGDRTQGRGDNEEPARAGTKTF